MNKKNLTEFTENKHYSEKQELSSIVVKEPEIIYETQLKHDLFEEERLYSHEEVFKEFAKRLNDRIGTHIPL